MSRERSSRRQFRYPDEVIARFDKDDDNDGNEDGDDVGPFRGGSKERKAGSDEEKDAGHGLVEPVGKNAPALGQVNRIIN